MSNQQEIISGLRRFTSGLESKAGDPKTEAFKTLGEAVSSLNEIKDSLSEMSVEGFQDEIQGITGLMDSLMGKQKQMMSQSGLLPQQVAEQLDLLLQSLSESHQWLLSMEDSGNFGQALKALKMAMVYLEKERHTMASSNMTVEAMSKHQEEAFLNILGELDTLKDKIASQTTPIVHVKELANRLQGIIEQIVTALDAPEEVSANLQITTSSSGKFKALRNGKTGKVFKTFKASLRERVKDLKDSPLSQHDNYGELRPGESDFRAMVEAVASGMTKVQMIISSKNTKDSYRGPLGERLNVEGKAKLKFTNNESGQTKVFSNVNFTYSFENDWTGSPDSEMKSNSSAVSLSYGNVSIDNDHPVSSYLTGRLQRMARRLLTKSNVQEKENEK